ncbi:MAG: hypothetical protein HQK95_04700 [Nitrospirae bacterium]|nr:hypothetical protein [Nitrospirota bacterium]
METENPMSGEVALLTAENPMAVGLPQPVAESQASGDDAPLPDGGAPLRHGGASLQHGGAPLLADDAPALDDEKSELVAGGPGTEVRDDAHCPDFLVAAAALPLIIQDYRLQAMC